MTKPQEPPSMFFSTTRSVRILFAFPADQLLLAFAEAASLWGGMYNPIVTNTEHLARAIEIYRPEYVVTVAAERGRVEALGLLPPHYLRTFEQEFQDNERPGLSIAMSDVTENIFEAEFKFARQFEVERHLPITPASAMRAYWIARLGAFVEPALSSRARAFQRSYAAYLRPTELRPTEYQTFDDTRQLCPIALTTFGLSVGAAPTTLVILDPENIDHVLAFWNIRALGWRTIALSIDQLATATPDTVDEYPIRTAKQVVMLCTLTGEQLSQVHRLTGGPIRSFEIQPDMFWDEVDRGDVYTPRTADALREQLLPRTETFSLQLQAPRLLTGRRSRTWMGGSSWVNTINRVSGSPLLMASFNDLTLHNSRLFGTLADVNPLKNEVAVVGDGDSSTAHLRWPTTFEYAQARLGQHGFTVTRPPLANVIDAAIDVHGFHNLRLLAERGIAHLWLRQGQGDRIERWHEACLTATKRRTDVAERWLTHMVDCGLLARGAFVRCSVCFQNGWVPLDHVGHEFTCELCSRRSSFPQMPLRAVFAWGYRRSGPLSQTSHARSCVSIALAMRYLVEMRSREATWTGPLYLTRGDSQIEVDGAIEFPTRVVGQTRWAFLEAKSENTLQEIDFARIRTLADARPGAAFVVATLRDEYTAAERTGLRAVAEHVEQRHGLLIPLTASELLTRSELTLVFPPHLLEEAAVRMRDYIT